MNEATASVADCTATSVTRYRDVRHHTERLAAALSPEDQCVQSMPDASPAKWHRAHTTWFFEQFVLAPYPARLSGVRPAIRFPVQFLLRGGGPAASASDRAAC